MIAATVADALMAGMAAAVAPMPLLHRMRAWARRAFPGSRPNAEEIAAWLTVNERARPAIAPVIGRAFADAYTQGYVVGAESARVLMDGGSPDWRFTPGDVAAARRRARVLGADHEVEQLWRDSAPLMRKAVAGRIDAIADVLAEGLEEKMPPEALAARVRTEVLEDSRWARGLAQTEVTRAVSAGTLSEYRRDKVPMKGWMTAFDQRVCKICKANEDAGPLGLEEAFPSGDLHPPGHPGGCRCGLVPAYRDRQQT